MYILLPDHFIDKHLVEMFPLFDQGVTSAGQSHDSGCDTHTPAASPKSGSLPGSGQDCLHRTISPASAL